MLKLEHSHPYQLPKPAWLSVSLLYQNSRPQHKDFGSPHIVLIQNVLKFLHEIGLQNHEVLLPMLPNLYDCTKVISSLGRSFFTGSKLLISKRNHGNDNIYTR